MTVFHLELKVRPEEGFLFDDNCVTVKPWQYNDVFTTEKKAVSFGKKMLTDRLKNIKKAFGYKSIDALVESELDYDFYIYEYDPDDKRNGRAGRGGFKWEYFVWWKYDYKGNVKDRTQWGDIGFMQLPSDFVDDAGTKFKPGDFVNIELDNEYYHSDSEKNRVYVVFSAPGKREDFRLGADSWENVYLLDYIDESCRFEHDHAHETKLRLYEGVVPDDHPLQILRKYATGELDTKESLWEDIVERRIVLDYPREHKSWCDIPELRDAL